MVAAAAPARARKAPAARARPGVSIAGKISVPGHDEALVETCENIVRKFVVAGRGCRFAGGEHVLITSLWPRTAKSYPQIREMLVWSRDLDGRAANERMVTFPGGGGISSRPVIRDARGEAPAPEPQGPQAPWDGSIPQIGFYGDRPVLNVVPGDPLARRLGELLSVVACRSPKEARALLAEVIERAKSHVNAVDGIEDAEVRP